jgi:predicted dehydrogenase
MTQRTIGIIMNGVTGRMGSNQHLARSIIAIRDQGGVLLPDGSRVVPVPVLVGRNPEKLESLAKAYHVERWSTRLDDCLKDSDNIIYFDTQSTSRREEGVLAAISAGKHVYCEKPAASTLDAALRLARRARDAGVKNGVVQDKLFLPGMLKLKRLVDSGFFGDILAVRGEFGYWVFEGDWQTPQRPSWNYRNEDGGGIIVDMFCHWRYLLENIFAPVRSVSSIGATHIPQRVDENGFSYRATAEDAAYATFELEGGIIAQMNSSWAVRVYRDDLLILQVDGTEGSAVAGLHRCWTQHRVNTPRASWNPDVPDVRDYRKDWQEVPDNQTFDNAFKVQWEMFLRHVVGDTPFPHDLVEGAKGVQLAELGLQSWRERRWIDVPELRI